MAQSQPKLTEAEYLSIERKAETKSEFLNGEMSAMSRASYRHNVLVSNLVRELGNSLRARDCDVLPSDMRVHIPATSLYTYPDITVVCGDAEFVDGEFDTLTNPTVLVEILSPSTADYDRGKKFENYRTIPSLQEVLLVDQDTLHVVRYRRLDDGSWNLTETRDRSDRLHLASIDVTLELAEIYAKVEFDDSSAGPAAVS